MAVTTRASTASHEAAERRQAARALLATPMLTAKTHPDDLVLVRRHAVALKSTFLSMLGYPLVVESHFARLVKGPLSPQAPTRPARRRSGAEFTPRTYTFVALACAGLLAPDVGEQVLVSSLVEQLRADAATAGITVDDEQPDRRHFVAAVELLVDWGVLVETDGTVAAWSERRDEALLTITRSLLPHILSRPLHTLDSPARLWALDPTEPEQPRRTLRRKLVENPLVHREDLTEGERDALSRERTELTRLLDEHFGLSLEVRAEGALAYDTDGELTDVEFPGSGTIRQAALLLLDALIDRSRPKPGMDVIVVGRPVPGVHVTWQVLDDELAELATRNKKVWRADRVDDLPKLRADVVATLTGMSLATATPDGLAVHPAAARYRPDPQRAPARPRARQDDERSQDLFTSGPADTETP
jgi:uncharacterized protein (TIGR02678 family)